MNRNRRTVFFRIMATIMCAACVAVMCSGYQARAETTPDYPVVSNATQFLQAFAEAEDGGTIGISDAINFYTGTTIGDENKRITIIRKSENAFIYFSGTGSYVIQNVIFDGNEIESMYPMAYAVRDITVKNCEFYNCVCNGEGAAFSNMERSEFYNCIFRNNSSTNRGGHVSMGNGIFDNCILTDGNTNYEGGAVACGAVDFNDCLITRNHAGMYGGGIYTSGITVLTGTKLYNNTAGACGPDYVDTQNGVHISESIEELAALYKSDGLKPISWEKTPVGFMNGGKLILEEFVEKPEPEQPTIPEEPENPTEPENPDNPDTPTEPENPENPDQPNTPTEPGENEQPKDEPGTGTDKPADDENKPSEPETPPDDTPNKGDEQPPADNPEEKPGVSGSGNAPATPSDSTGNNGGNNTSNSTSTTTTSDNRTTDNSDNSRYSSTSDSNNTSTVNNYYQQEKQPSSSGESVQTIVVPIGNTGNGEPLQQTIRGESPEGTTATGSLEGLTLNINVNTASPDQVANTSPVQQSGISWYQAIVLCLLSAILVCLLKRH